MKNYNRSYLIYLMNQDLERIRHEVALLCRFYRAEQSLSAGLIEQKTGGVITAKQLDKIETEQKQKINLDYLILLARAVNRRLQVTFIPIDEPEQLAIPDSWWKPAPDPEEPVFQSDYPTQSPTQSTPFCSD